MVSATWLAYWTTPNTHDWTTVFCDTRLLEAATNFTRLLAASTFFMLYQHFLPHIRYPAVRLFCRSYICECDMLYSEGSDAEALSMPTPTGVIAPSLVLGALLMRCFTSLLPERCFVPLLGSDSPSDAWWINHESYKLRLAFGHVV